MCFCTAYKENFLPLTYFMYVGGLSIGLREGTQLRLKQLGISLGSFDRVFITHLHADHVFGLPGLLSSMHLLERKNLLYPRTGRHGKMISFYFDFLGRDDSSFPIVHVPVEGDGLLPYLKGIRYVFRPSRSTMESRRTGIYLTKYR